MILKNDNHFPNFKEAFHHFRSHQNTKKYKRLFSKKLFYAEINIA